MIADFLSNISAKYYENLTMLSPVIAKTSGMCFFETRCIYSECAHKQHVRRTLTLTLTHTITAYSVSGIVVRVRILICATRQKSCRKRVYPKLHTGPTLHFWPRTELSAEFCYENVRPSVRHTRVLCHVQDIQICFAASH